MHRGFFAQCEGTTGGNSFMQEMQTTDTDMIKQFISALAKLGPLFHHERTRERHLKC